MNSFVDKVSVSRPAQKELTASIGMSPKRVVDVILALCGIVLLAPLLISCYLAVALSSPGPVLFRHRRVGFNGKHFDCLKFRTMVTDAPERLARLPASH